ncbi:hypothetical protein Tco_1131623, partial [Tanacetum coccineum]
MMRKRYPNPLALVAHYQTKSNLAQYPQQLSSTHQTNHSSQPYSLTYEAPHHPQQYQHTYQPQIRDDPITCLIKAMAFMLTAVASSFPSTNNQLRTSSNLRNQATIQDGSVTVQQVQGRQSQSSSLGTIGNATTSKGNNAAGQARVVKCSNSQESGLVLDEEQLTFLADPRITDCHDVQLTIIHNAAFQTDDLNAYDFDCNDISSAKAVLMANLSSYGSDYENSYFQ